MATEQARTGEFIVSEANGTLSRSSIVIVSGQDLAAGTVLGKITASGKYKAYSNAAGDGSETAAGILYAAVDASAADTKGVMIDYHAEVAEDSLTGIDAAGKVDLLALKIKVR